jgi:hypothetical protein
MATKPKRSLTPCDAPSRADLSDQLATGAMLDLEELSPWQFVNLRKQFVIVGRQVHRSNPGDGDVVYFLEHHGVYRPVQSVRDLLLTLFRLKKGAPW